MKVIQTTRAHMNIVQLKVNLPICSILIHHAEYGSIKICLNAKKNAIDESKSKRNGWNRFE